MKKKFCYFEKILHWFTLGPKIFFRFFSFFFFFFSFLPFPFSFLFISMTIEGPSGPPWGPGPYTIQNSGPPPSFGATAGQNASISIIFQSLYNLFGEENPSVELSTFISNKNEKKVLLFWKEFTLVYIGAKSFFLFFFFFSFFFFSPFSLFFPFHFYDNWRALRAPLRPGPL